ncbi:MAG: tRNA (N(6)-L-threonylcarbamoyladenosine(37)-C(2))-methylthiotransferase MtaB [Ignavibacteriae bacterium HGW-Ignavibacteriae-3]|nr:MAG: tRNA (N(6)-L-threonylcarbamoyladenosine(37)-C(2))-methylthiotransferase MtaB [Ignavibacteriae bacterium HGW-Ignavibacteriae-3]
MSQKVAFHTLGCKLNFSETSTIGKQFLRKGFDIVDYNDHADVYVINTCTVTDNADKECRQVVRRALKNNPNGFVVVTGCYAQLRPEEIAKIDGVDAVLGSNEKFNLFDYMESFEKKDLSCIHVSPTEKLDSFHSSFSTEADNRTRAFFKVQDGCDYKCSFCTIPLARGKSRSADPETVVKEFKELLAAGYKEIILTGVNVGDYGSVLNHNHTLDHDQDYEQGHEPQINLYSLLKMMLKVEGDYRIRISSIEPNLLTDEILELTANEKRMCNHFHIPLQSGSSKILRMMQRRYRTEDYSDLIRRAAGKIDDLGIGVDVIVGFPGETEDDFIETYNFLRDLPISYLHVFTYSERPNTKAMDMEGQVDIVERKKRANMLRILSEKKRREFYERMKGKKMEVLFEYENHDGYMKGFSSNYVRIKALYNSEIINKFAQVKITEVDENICTAENLSINVH